MTTAAIPKRRVLSFLDDLYISHETPIITLHAKIDISIPGRRLISESMIQFHLFEEYVVIKLLKAGLSKCYPVRFDSRSDLFTEKKKTCFCIEGYSFRGLCKLSIYPVSGLAGIFMNINGESKTGSAS